jgi:hypothetical protein
VARRVVDDHMRRYYDHARTSTTTGGSAPATSRDTCRGEVVALDPSESMVAVAAVRMVDSARREGVPPEEHQQRVLNDGSRHTVYKRVFDPEELAAELGGGALLHSGRWFVAVAA